MTPAGANFALIGRSYPHEAFESWFNLSQSARERRGSTALARHAPELKWSARLFPRKEAWRS